jgi:hypothetical protein
MSGLLHSVRTLDLHPGKKEKMTKMPLLSAMASGVICEERSNPVS